MMSQYTADQAEANDGIEQRRREVAVRLASRIPYREMARQLDVSVGTISSDVKAIRKAWQDRYADEYHAHAAEQLATLDIIKGRLLPRVLAGGKPGTDPETGRQVATMDLFALDRMLGLMDREARLLGLDAPQRIEVQMHVELVAKAIELVVVDLGVDPDVVRPLVGAKLRELGAVTEGRNGNGR